MQGIAALEREKWEEALTHLVKASTVSSLYFYIRVKSDYEQIYSKLGSISQPDTKALCQEKVEEIDHRIRYCLQYLRKSKGQAGTNIKLLRLTISHFYF